MTATQQTASSHATGQRTRGMTIHVAGSGLFVVMNGRLEMFRGTFEQCYGYVSSVYRGSGGA